MANKKAVSDDDLARAAGGGDTGAFAELLDRHGQRIAGLARRMLAGQAMAGDVDDVVQETFLRLWVRTPQWLPRQPGGAGD
ncbi:MAG: RNA polymerase sigma factor, partial [Hyphomicrobiales bacterium]